MKTCPKCKKEFEATTDNFYRDRSLKDGLKACCKKCTRQKVKRYQQKHRDWYLQYQTEYRKQNKDKRRQYAHKWYRENREEVLRKSRDAYYANKHLIQKQLREKYRNQPGFRLHIAMESGIRHSLEGSSKKRRRWESLVGYTLDDLRSHLESQFQDGMTWDNYGEWHIDHIIPVTAFNFTTPEHKDFKRCWALDNLQPMWGAENISKSNKIEGEFQPSLLIRRVE